MSKPELLKIQTCVLKVNIHCEGCKQKVKKILQKVDGVYSVSIDVEQGKVAVSGNIDPTRLLKKLEKSGKHAEIWGFQKGASYNQVHLNNQFKNMQIQNIKGAKGNQSLKGGKGQQKGGLQAMQHQMKGNKDMKLPQKEQKSVKFNMPEDEFDVSDHDFDDEFDEFDDEYDDEEEEEFGHSNDIRHGNHLSNKKMPVMGNSHGLQGQGNYGNMIPIMNSNNHGSYGNNGLSNMHAMSEKKGSGNGVKVGAKKEGDFELPIEIKGKGTIGKNEMKNEMKNGNGGKNGGGNKKGGNQKQDCKDKNGGKKGVGLFGKIFGKKNKKKISGKKGSISVGAINNSRNVVRKKDGGKQNGDYHGINKMKNSYHEVDVINQNRGGKHSGSGGMNVVQIDKAKNMGQLGQNGNANNMGQMGQNGNPKNMGQMCHLGNGGRDTKGNQMGPMGNYQMGHMSNMPPLQGLSTQPMGNGGYYQGMGSYNPYQQQHYYQGMGQGNPCNQQQYMAMMMNQQRGDGNDMFPPIMYARSQPAVNYAALPSMMGGEPYHHIFNDENANSCSIM